MSTTPELEDVSKDQAQSTERGYQSAKKYFNQYLETLRIRIPDHPTKIEELTAQHIDEKLLGKFASYLMGCPKVKKCDTALVHLSKVKSLLVKQFSTHPLFAAHSDYYTRLRANLTRRYMAKCAQAGTSLCEHSVPMTEEDLLWMCQTLLKKSTDWGAVLNRGLLVLQWQILGRISEVSRLQFTDLKYIASAGTPNTIKVHLTRLKVTRQHPVTLFPHSEHWELCPIHAIACIVLAGKHSTLLFEAVAKGGEAHYTNRLLHDLSEENEHAISAAETGDDTWTLSEGLTSQSSRSGASTHADQHSQMQTQWLIPRGGWTLDGIQTIFNYVSGTQKTDSRVGRALAGWSSVDHG